MPGRALILAASVVAACPMLLRGEASGVRRQDAKAYDILDKTGRLPRLDRGDAARVVAYPSREGPHVSADPAPAGGEARRPIVDATCDADLVVIARVESAVAFAHPNGRWILTTHDLVVTHVARVKDMRLRDVTRVRYVHPSGRDTIAGRAITTTVERFPPLVVDDELLFFLVRIDKSPSYRASLETPPLAIRGGLLYELTPRATDAGPSIDGTSARAALRTIGAAVCRPAPIRARPEPVAPTSVLGPP